jgi:hypothetical protein
MLVWVSAYYNVREFLSLHVFKYFLCASLVCVNVSEYTYLMWVHSHHNYLCEHVNVCENDYMWEYLYVNACVAMFECDWMYESVTILSLGILMHMC